MAAALEPNLAVPMELEKLFLGHHARALKAAYRITGNLADAEDAAQAVFLRIAQRGSSREAIQNPESYVYRAAINAALDLLRSRARAGTAVPIEVVNDPGRGRPGYTTAEGGCATEEVRRWLRLALAKLGPKTAEVFVLRYLEDYDNSEIARMLHTSKAVVAVMLFRARARLRDDFRSFMRGKP